jgi:hypothetical protein
MSSARALMLCADDFGLSAGVSRGIAALARQGRLQAISCLTGVPAWRENAPLLRDLPSGVDIGLHFNLTEGEPLSPELRARWPRFPALPRLIAAAHVGAVPRAAIAAEFGAQLAAFLRACGREPAFIDGHQHVHHLPGVRDVLLAGIDRMAQAPAVRNTGRIGGTGFTIKRQLIAGTGGRALHRELRRRGLAHNAALLGVYDFQPGSYRHWMQGWLAAVPPEGALLFCHPGAADASVPDAIAAARGPEAEYLASSAFSEDVAAAGVSLARVWRRDATSETSRRD